jgi:hypothetical protein
MTLRRFSSAKKLLISAQGIYHGDFPTNDGDVDPFDCAQDKPLQRIAEWIGPTRR